MKKLLLLLLLLPSAAFGDLKDWTLQDQRLYGSFVTLQAMDMMQAFVMIECQQTNPQCGYYEANPILGTHPNKAEVVMFKVAVNFLVYNMLDKKLKRHERRGTLIALNAISIVPVVHNNYIGLGFYVPIIPYNQFINK